MLSNEVSTLKSETAGYGLFVHACASKGDVLFQDDDVFVANGLLLLKGVPCPGISQAWPLALHLVRMPQRPAWFDALDSNLAFARAIISEDKKLIPDVLASQLRSHPDLLDVFARVVTNFFAVMIDGQCITYVGRLSSRINHSADAPNVCNQTLIDSHGNMRFVWRATCDISAGSELLFDYGQDYSSHPRFGWTDPTWQMAALAEREQFILTCKSLGAKCLKECECRADQVDDLWDLWREGASGAAKELVRLLPPGPARGGPAWAEVVDLLISNHLLSDDRIEPSPDLRGTMDTMAKTLSELRGSAGEPYRNLRRKGRFFYRSARAASKSDGRSRSCFANALALASDLEMWVGYAMAKDMNVPVAHCWNKLGDQVIDSTPNWHAQNAFYWGMRVHGEVTRAVLDASTHGDEFMDSWRSAVQNVDKETAQEWRLKLGWDFE